MNKVELNRLAEAVRTTGEMLSALRKQGMTSGKWEGSQFKAVADQIAHDYLSLELTKLDPMIPILSEEDLESLQSYPETYWLIDPIDGTASFAQGFSGYVCQAALMVNQLPLLASVFAPEHTTMFLAEAGKGATCNGRLLKTVVKKDKWTLIDNYPQARGLAAEAYTALPCSSYVESGSIGLKICRIAEGVAELFVKDINVRDWDLAAPHLILKEAGGVLNNLTGNEIIYGLPSRQHHGLLACGSTEILSTFVTWSNSR